MLKVVKNVGRSLKYSAESFGSDGEKGFMSKGMN